MIEIPNHNSLVYSRQYSDMLEENNKNSKKEKSRPPVESNNPTSDDKNQS